MNETKDAIKAAFIDLYKKQSFEKMSVKGLCIQVPVARTTFYEYYDNLGTLKDEIEDELVNGLLNIAKTNVATCAKTMDLSLFFDKTFQYIKEHWDANCAFLVSQPNYSYIKKWKKAIKYHFNIRFPDKENTPNYELVLEVIASAVIGAYTYWLDHPDEVDTERLNEMSVRMLNSVENII